ncbi:MAG: tRNA uridine-5-carboxymethylaminomethyl(34) synthesis GTPase MnmE [Pseudomonadales bacterium]|nr:tRNA uridine-5-carboxymethylaminomethyl(34) synthesis GTPase MnmE [Pseudomonadales bacterium]
MSATDSQAHLDTIAAQATPAGRGGVGIIRLSGPQASSIASSMCRRNAQLKPRFAHFHQFYDQTGTVLDEGLVLFFPGPNSFTGEDVVELQGHGGPMVMASLLKETLQLGARLANPGEFSERAFLNDKLDLAQAEAIADLIDAASEQAAKSAVRSLQGAFSERIHGLVEQLTQLRMYVEAAIDFPEEEIDFISDGKIAADLSQIVSQLKAVLEEANRGVLLKEGMKVVLAGRPNAGKSSLLNALAGRESAIVTPIAGTTRDLLREHIHIDGMPLHIIDTAGLRESADEVEQEGIRRAWKEIEQADRVLLLVDSTQSTETDPNTIWPDFVARLSNPDKITVVHNKIDLVAQLQDTSVSDQSLIRISAKSGLGIDALRSHLKEVMGYQAVSEGGFTARQRHIEALQSAQTALHAGRQQLNEHGAAELLAEDLRAAQDFLGEITGEVTPDALLGRIFSTFCIGK